jgi:hypothetical protein
MGDEALLTSITSIISIRARIRRSVYTELPQVDTNRSCEVLLAATPSPQFTREDLLNAAAIQNLRHGGRAFVVKAPEMPVAAEVAAFLRF